MPATIIALLGASDSASGSLVEGIYARAQEVKLPLMVPGSIRLMY